MRLQGHGGCGMGVCFPSITVPAPTQHADTYTHPRTWLQTRTHTKSNTKSNVHITVISVKKHTFFALETYWTTGMQAALSHQLVGVWLNQMIWTRVIKSTHKRGSKFSSNVFDVSSFLSAKPHSAPSNIPKANFDCLPATPARVRLARYLNAKRLNVSRHVY